MAIFSLSLDDVGPHPKCDPFPHVIDRCNKLIERWPGIKIDFFTSAAYARLNEEPYFLTQYPEWIKQMNELPAINFRVNAHGYWHRRLSNKYGNSNNNEFEKTNEQETRILIEHMAGEFNAAGLKLERVFRAPGFHLGVEAVKVLREMGFVVAGNQQYEKLKDQVPGLKYITSNWDCLADCTLAGDVLAVGHTSNWTPNYFGPEVYNKVVRCLETRPFTFRFLSEL
jgi:hypothetical protein